MAIWLAFNFIRPDRAGQHVKMIADLCSPYVAETHAGRPEIWHSGNFAIIAWPRRHESKPLRSLDTGTITLDGYVTHPNVLSHIQRNGGHLHYEQSTGGVAAFCHVSRSGHQMTLWSTQPPCLGIYWSRKHPDFVVAGTRPMLTAFASEASDFIRCRTDYIPIHLAAGSAIDYSTPFDGVRRVTANRALTIGGGVICETKHPLSGLQGMADASDDEKTNAVTDALLGSLANVQGKATTLLVSGGKDSRTVAAAAAAVGLKPHCISYGQGEAETATRVANAIGSTIDIRRHRAFANPVEAACRYHLRTDGLIASVPHQIRYDGQEKVEGPLLHGHGHLLRGGFATNLNLQPSMIDAEALKPFSTGWVQGEATRQASDAVSRWRETRVFGDPLDQLYWINFDLRLGPYLTPSIISYIDGNDMVFPLLDERVAQIASALSAADKQSERIVFSAIRKLAPELAAAPLNNKRWRFEEKGEVDVFPGYEQREPDKPAKANGSMLEYVGDVQRFADDFKVVAEFSLSSRTYPLILPMLKPDISDLIKSYALGKGMTAAVRRYHAGAQGTANRMVNHVFALCTLYECSWMRPSQRGRSPVPASSRTEPTVALERQAQSI